MEKTSNPVAAVDADSLRREQLTHLFPVVKSFYREPLVLDRGQGVWLWDVEGEKYLDLFAGILTTSLGHAHPEVVERIREQAGRLGHTSTLYLTEPQISVARKLSEMAPEGLTRTFFTNSGTEAVETAILTARLYTGRSEIVALRHAYSGRSLLATSITAHASWRPAGGIAAGVVHARSPYAYRCPFKRPCDESCIDRFIDDLVEVIETTTTGRPAALMFEPIQGVGGYIVLPDQYMRRAAEVIRSYGGLLIVDEVQTGFGRTGSHWWGIDHAGVAPDLMVMAKGLAAGFPAAATMAREEVAAAWNVKSISTFGGNPIAMAAADATLEVMRREDTPSRCAARGRQLSQGLEALKQQYPWIGDARGRGLMQALELVHPQDKSPHPQRALALLEAARRERLLLGLGGLHNNVVRIGPSLLIEEHELAEGLQRLTRACAAVEAG
ncbi:MAG TPA: aspartate aminotransferase family protein [Acidobacteriota bacterium]|nr:aspartate aminotransferase family protein [Acidobacteriota bacterium]